MVDSNEKKKRGRKPKKINDSESLEKELLNEESLEKELSDSGSLEKEVKSPKKRGRKPKPKTEQEPKVYKKRGRKPKPKTEEVKIPKKRGRKPKDKYNVVEKNDIVDITNEENVVLHLPINTNSISNDMSAHSDILRYTPIISNPTPYDPDNNMFSIEETEIQHKNKIEPNKLKLVIEYPEENIDVNKPLEESIETKDINLENKEIDDIHNKYDKILNQYAEKRNIDLSNNNNKIGKSKIHPIFYDYQEANKKKAWPTHSNINCLWDFKPFTGKPYGLPMKKIGNEIYMFGNFCCPQCAAAYNFNSNDESDEIWERYSLLNWLYQDELENDNDTVKIAPSRLTLKENGGTLSLDEFRSVCKNSSKDYNIIYPPMISLIPVMEEINIDLNHKKSFVPVDKEHMKKVDNEFKLKRTKPLPNYKNTLESCMLLKYV